MGSKVRRQRLILDIVRDSRVATQAGLRRRLHARGVSVDQATLSRDVHELGLVKVAEAEGYRYVPIEEASPGGAARGAGYLKRLVRSIESAGNLIVVKTDQGAAQPVAESIDRMGLDDVLGTVAGDNTLLVVVKDAPGVRRVAIRLRERLT